MTVVVFGSINMDVVVQVPRLPVAGETLIGQNFFTAFGGKGANQAVAVARLGVPVRMVGQVGNDDFGQTLRMGLQAVGVNVDQVTVNPDIHSGIASIVVGETGENSIACAAGANHRVGQAEVKHVTNLGKNAKVVLFELGIPLETVIAAAKAIQTYNCTVILDPAPAIADFPPELYSLIDILTPNEIEATQLVGFPVDSPATAEKAALVLQEKGVPTVIITLGEQGVLCRTGEETILIPAIPAKVVDTVAAGDAFNGALAAALASGKSLQEALHWGTIAGSMSVTKKGAQSSLPTREEFERRLGNINP
jgi:ribokinase